MKNKTLKICFFILILIILNTILLAPMKKAGWWRNHEHHTYVIRLIAFQEALNEHGSPRWIGNMCAHRGSPMFTFYAPGLFYASTFFAKLGINEYDCLQLSILFFRFLGATAIFLFLFYAGFNIPSSFLGSLLFSIFPYQCTNIFVRGAFAEFAAMNTLPLVALFLLLTIKKDRRWAIGLIPSVAAVIFIHNITAMLAAFFCSGLILIWLPLAFRHKIIVKRFLALFAGAILGIGVSAFFWFPAISLKKYVNINIMYNPDFLSRYSRFLKIKDLFVRGEYFGMDFHFPLIFLFLLGVSIYCYFKIKRDNRSSNITSSEKDIFASKWWYAGAFIMSVITLCTSLRLTRIMFHIIPYLYHAQFPYRIFSILTSMTAIGAAHGIHHISRGIKFNKSALLAMAALSFIMVDFGLAEVRLFKDERKNLESIKNEFDKSYVDTVSLNEYTPACIDPDEARKVKMPPKGSEVTAGENKKIKVNGYTMKSGLIKFNVTSSKEVTLDIPHYWFPGWKAYMGEKELELTQNKNTGEMTLDFPGGKNVPITIRFADSEPVKKGKAISLASLILSGIWILSIVLTRKRQL